MAHLSTPSDDLDNIFVCNTSDQRDWEAVNCSILIRENVSSTPGNTYGVGNSPTPEGAAIILTILGLILLIGIVGNILVLIVIAVVKSMHTTVNKCILSLAVVDLIILILLPIGPIAGEFGYFKFPYGIHLCFFLNMCDRGPTNGSILIFVYVTIDRYFALCYPLNTRRLWTGRRTYVKLAAIWIVSCALSVPFIITGVYDVNEKEDNVFHFCYWDMGYVRFIAVVVSVPLLLVCYGRMICQVRANVRKPGTGDAGGNMAGRRGRGQVVIMLLAVVVVFVVSQVPFATILFLDYFIPSVFSFSTYNRNSFIIIWSCRLLVYINSASNPVIYFSLSTNFRRGLEEVFCRKDPLTQVSSLGTVGTGHGRTSH